MQPSLICWCDKSLRYDEDRSALRDPDCRIEAIDVFNPSPSPLSEAVAFVQAVPVDLQSKLPRKHRKA